MKTTIDELIERYPCLDVCREDILKLEDMMLDTFSRGGKLLLCGNGGSAADCDHIAGELLKGFLSKRPLDKETADKFRRALGERAEEYISTLQGGLPVISLPSETAVVSAFSNDVDPEFVYAQLVLGFASENDLLIAISTSGNSKNIVRAAETAKALGISVAALTGKTESALSAIADVSVRVPERETYKVQELHLPVYHYLCAAVEEKMF